MLTILPIDSGTLDSLMLAIGILGILLIIGMALRSIIPLFRRYFIPAALIGGVIGLAAGPYGFGLVGNDINSTWAAMPGILISVVFAPMLMGQELPKFRESVKVAAPMIVYSYFSSFIIVGIPALLTFFLFTPVFGVNPLFSTIFEVSWPGGHGTAAGMTPAYEDLGWADGGSLALGSATAGLLFGIIGGMIMLNLAAKRGRLAATRGKAELKTASDLLPEPDIHSKGRINKASLDNLALHVTLIAIAILIGWALKFVVDMVITGVPLFPLAMIGGLIIQLIAKRSGLAPLIDKATMSSIAGWALDFLVVSAVASISIPVILDNWVSLLICLIVVATISLGVFYYLSPRLFKEDWFEAGIVNFGTCTGVVSVGLLLLRAADPEMKTDAGRAFALKSPFTSPFIGGGFVTALYPILAIRYGNLWLGIGCLVVCALILLAAKIFGLWNSPQRVRSDSQVYQK
ncbi:sodium/glutamate symporter [Brevibacterium aurantiacum]|uniref:Sodium:glutamate symporter n=1 Tax=Brevibacterium aurantiacum TaxID=273384 RepID=A0A556CCC2_BREAU|nr:sodium/glutamate symporter [Brevibacterium aurantiacum]TSI15097.1 sodium:glutamate symporter [Brevibacterium aurantiacum]